MRRGRKGSEVRCIRRNRMAGCHLEATAFSIGGWPSRALPRHGMPHPWPFHGWATLPLAPCSLVTSNPSRPCYTCGMPANLHRYYGAGYLHYITTSCYQRRPLLAGPHARDLFLEVMEQVRHRHRLVVVGYVVMPEHVHLLFSEPEQGNPSLVMAALKQTFSRRLLQRLRVGAEPRTWPNLEYTRCPRTHLATSLL